VAADGITDLATDEWLVDLLLSQAKKPPFLRGFGGIEIGILQEV